MSADLLYRAAERLRDPERVNNDHRVDVAVAAAMEAVARVIRYDERMVARVGYGELVEVARVVLGLEVPA